MADFDCNTCGAHVTDNVHLPANADTSEITTWWDSHAQDWCPVYGEFRQIIRRGEKPCK